MDIFSSCDVGIGGFCGERIGDGQLYKHLVSGPTVVSLHYTAGLQETKKRGLHMPCPACVFGSLKMMKAIKDVVLRGEVGRDGDF